VIYIDEGFSDQKGLKPGTRNFHGLRSWCSFGISFETQWPQGHMNGGGGGGEGKERIDISNKEHNRVEGRGPRGESTKGT